MRAGRMTGVVLGLAVVGLLLYSCDFSSQRSDDGAKTRRRAGDGEFLWELQDNGDSASRAATSRSDGMSVERASASSVTSAREESEEAQRSEPYFDSINESTDNPELARELARQLPRN